MPYEVLDGGRYEVLPEDTKKPAMSGFDRFTMGITDPIHGGAQLLTKALPDSWVQAGNRLNNLIADKTGLVARLPEGGVDQQVRDREQAYQQSKPEGMDWMRLGGNLVSPANLAIGGASTAASIPARLAVSAAQGAAGSALAPVGSGDFADEKLKQVGMGAGLGAAVPAVVGGLSRVVSPKASTNQDLRLLIDEGVRPTIGQTLGGWANRLEEKAQSMPIMGDAIQAARSRAGDDLSRAAINRALAPIGDQLPSGVAGNDAILYARKALGGAYDSLLPRMSVQRDQAFDAGVNNLTGMVNNGAISPLASAQFRRFLANDVEPLFQGQGVMNGDTLKRLQSKITEQVQRTQASTNADERLLSNAYKELGDQLNQLSVRTNPQLADELTRINAGYANFKRVQRAASSVAAESGEFTPAQLHNAVKAADRSKDKARFAEGNALMQDLSAPGKSILSNKVPNSGTAERLMVNLGALGSGAINPAIPLALGAGALTYTGLPQSAARFALTARPAAAKSIAGLLDKTTPVLAPTAGLLGLQLLNQ